MNTICVTIDGWHIGYVGAYGNGWIDTPCIDRLAADAMVADRFMLDSVQPLGLLESAWRGGHPGDPRRSDRAPLPELLGAKGVRTILWTDDPEAAALGRDCRFTEIIEFPRADREQLAEQVEETHLMQCFAEMAHALPDGGEPFLVWLHLSSMLDAWDAPLEFRDRYADPEDPTPDESAVVPNWRLTSGFDPDLLLQASQAYAGQATLLDQCIGGVASVIDDMPLADNTMLLLAGSQGFPLGEHGRVGLNDRLVYAEAVHAPLIVRHPRGLGRAVRCQELLQPNDLFATLSMEQPTVPENAILMPQEGRSLLPLLEEDESGPSRDRVLVMESGETAALYSPAWFARPFDGGLILPFCHLPSKKNEPSSSGVSLYAKPDDRWEVNDVADRLEDVAGAMRSARDATLDAAKTPGAAIRDPLDDLLMHPAE